MEEESNKAKRVFTGILIFVAIVLALTWAVSVFFEMAILKALAAVVLGLFVVIIALFMSGFGF